MMKLNRVCSFVFLFMFSKSFFFLSQVSDMFVLLDSIKQETRLLEGLKDVGVESDVIPNLMKLDLNTK